MVSPEELAGSDRARHLSEAEAVDLDGANDGTVTEVFLDAGTMVRSEERLAVDTEQVATGRARLRKFQVTEEQQITVTVAREQVRVEYDSDAELRANDRSAQGSPGGVAVDATGAPSVGTQDEDRAGRDRWMVLYAQRPVVTMDWVAVERVRFGTVALTSQQTVTGEVRSEQLEVVTDHAAAKGVAR